MANETFEVPAPEMPEEAPDYYVEQSTAIRELEIKMWHNIGKTLAEVDNLEPYAKEMKKHVSELKAAVEFFKKYPDFDSIPFDKASSWGKIKKDLGLSEKRERKSLKAIINEKLLKNQKEFELTGDVYIKGKLDEDKELLNENE